MSPSSEFKLIRSSVRMQDVSSLHGVARVAFGLLIAVLLVCATANSAEARRTASSSAHTLADSRNYQVAIHGTSSHSEGGGVCSTESVGDFNADGFEDYAVGRCYEGGGSGEVDVIYGRSAYAAHDFRVDRLPAGSVTRITSTPSGSWFGYSVSGGYDINGDKIDDLIVGAPHAVGGAGAAYVIFGKRDPDARIEVGRVVAGGGSLGTHGGIFLPASVGGDSEAESVDLGTRVTMFPRPGMPNRGAIAVADPRNGNTLTSCDASGDDHCGTVWVLTNFPYSRDGFGPWDSSSRSVPMLALTAADAQEDGMFPYGCRVDGPEADAHFGEGLDGGPDVTGDGVPDLLVGAPGFRGRGMATVISGQRCLDRARTANASGCEDGRGSYFACGVIDAKLIDVYGYDADGFSVDAMPPSTSSLTRNQSLGSSLAILDLGTRRLTAGAREDLVAGDLTGDGAAEIVIGDPQADLGRNNNGGIWTISSRGTTAGSSVQLQRPGSSKGADPSDVLLTVGPSSESRLGSNLATPGDIDGDGLVDLVASAPGAPDRDPPKRDSNGPLFVIRLGTEDAAFVLYGQDMRRGFGAHDVWLGTSAASSLNYEIKLPEPRDGYPDIPIAAGDFDGDIVDSEVVVTGRNANPDGIFGAGSWYRIDDLRG